MEMYGNTICITYSELVGSGIISKPTYKKLLRDGRLKTVSRGGNGRKALIDYWKMPDRIRAAYDERFSDAREAMIRAEEEARKQEWEQRVSKILRYDEEAVNFYRDYRPEIDSDRQKEYVLNAQVLNEMIRVEKERTVEHSKGGFSRRRAGKQPDGIDEPGADGGGNGLERVRGPGYGPAFLV